MKSELPIQNVIHDYFMITNFQNNLRYNFEKQIL